MATHAKPATFSTTAAVVRYQTRDIERSTELYTKHLGFELAKKAGPVTILSRGDLHLLLSAPQASGSRPLPGGEAQEPGGSNRIVLYVDDIDATIGKLEAAHVRFRGKLESGPGGKQIQIEDPDGNPIELHENPTS